MLFYYIRHGEPIYDPDSLTPMGVCQAKALAKRLARYGLDKIYCSTSNRAIQTAEPTCQLLGKEPELLDFANERYAWREFTVDKEDGSGRGWAFQNPKFTRLFHEPEVRKMAENWYEHPELAQYNFQKGIDRIYDAADAFLESLGYEHIRHTGTYKVKKASEERIALFAHQGFGLAFLSCLLDIPYPIFCTQFDMCHSGMTVIEFAQCNGCSVPKILTLSSDAHLYREELPTLYNNKFSF